MKFFNRLYAFKNWCFFGDKSIKKYMLDVKEYNDLIRETGGIPITDEYPCLNDYLNSAGSVDSHYFIQDIYVAEQIAKAGTRKHFDIGSRVDGFISHLLSNPGIEEVVMLDIRPFPIKVPKLSFIQTDATSMDNIPDNSVASISSLHALEHFGLGRYGDSIDPLACFKAMKTIQRITMPDGRIYISVPITSVDECHFNAHRIFSPITIISQFDECVLEEMVTIHSDYKMEIIKEISMDINDYSLGPYDCGIFIFRKKNKK